jgi:hypothetical protein
MYCNRTVSIDVLAPRWAPDYNRSLLCTIYGYYQQYMLHLTQGA